MNDNAKNEGRPIRVSEIPKDIWLKSNNFVLAGKFTIRGRDEEEIVVAQWHMPARGGLRVIGAIAKQLLSCWRTILWQNTKIAVRWLFWRN